MTSEIERILSLPRRPNVDCERRPDRSWAPEAEALIEHVTAKYTRGERLSCACRGRRVVGLPGGRILVYHEPAAKEIPPLPVELTVEAFCIDGAHDVEAVRTVRALRPGEEVRLHGLGYPVCLTAFNPVQAWALRELEQTSGFFGMISVGGGKTILNIEALLAVPGSCSGILFAKPDQRLHYRNAYLRLREHFRVPSIVFDDMKDSYRVTGTPVLRFVPYSVLSNPKSSDLLEQYSPDTIICDEAHLLSNRSSSRTMRAIRYLRKRNDEDRPVNFCCSSGSIIKRSIKDASHLAAFSLGLGSPYPIPSSDADEWAMVIDPSPMPDTSSSTATALRRAFGDNRKSEVAMLVSDNSRVRNGFRDRVIATPGVVFTRSSSVTASIVIKERIPERTPADVKAALKLVRDGMRPDGEEFAELGSTGDLEQARCIREVASGFYSYWFFPEYGRARLTADRANTEKDKAVAEAECERITRKIDAWFDARKPFNKELRAKILCGEVHLDSRKLCENAAERAWRQPRYEGDLAVWPSEHWPAWAAVKDTLVHETREKWVDEFLARDAAAWATEHRGIVWCQSTAFGEKVAKLAGLPYHAGGKHGEANILAETGKRSVIASYKAHHEGRDGLQLRFCEQLVAEIPSSGDGWQQLLGRLAREGQQADTIETWVYLHVAELRSAFRKALMYAKFIEATSPNRQTLLMADIAIPGIDDGDDDDSA